METDWTDSILCRKDLVLSKLRHYYYSGLYVTGIIGQNNDISFITDGLYLSNICIAYSLKDLKQYKVTHIINTVYGLDPAFPNDFKYLNLGLRDIPKENIQKVLDECNEFIDDAIQNGGRVLVHCVFGVSRSASIVINYLMHSQNMSYTEAYDYVKDKRPIINPNSGFVNQLS